MGDDYLDTTPARDPPPGHESNLVDPESLSYQLVTVIAVTSALMLLLTGCRTVLYRSNGEIRWARGGAQHPNTSTFQIATLAYAVVVLCLCDMPGNSLLGIHLWDASLRKYIQYLKLSIADMVIHRLCNTLIKVAFLVFYLRLFGPVRQVRIMVWAGLAVVVTFCIVFMIIEIVVCVPWPSEHDGFLDDRYFARCLTISPNLFLGGTYFSVIMDFYILFIPLLQVKNLVLNKKRKIGISFVFLTGLIAIATGIANLIIQYFFDVDDFSWWSGIAMYITGTEEITLTESPNRSYLELSIGLVALSLPVVIAIFVSRLTDLGRTLSSWVRRSREHLGSGESTSSLTPDGSRATAGSAPELPQHLPGSGLPGLRKFIRNLNRPRAQKSEPGTVMSTFNDLTTADISYHAQLKKTLKPSQTVRSSNKYEKF
ncbi:hypothetical protein PG994_013341 [Apiospora phragmitis]|uniref:Rhodopsin domain-containing protein n=1 Tax=Apiospora phragmitis TaxID=2905665 RepID=A0ABR1TAX4_9PEZI